MTQKDLLDKIWEIIDNSGYGYFYAKKDVHDIWHLIYSSGVEMSDIKKQELFVQSIKELEMASGSEVRIDDLEEIINDDYSIEAIKKRRDSLPHDDYRLDWYDGILAQLSAKQ